jgi:predicted nuclease with TOPRIM domain
MNDATLIALGGLVGVLVTAAFQYLTARLSARSRQEKAVDLSQKYLNLADMTVDQLEERINLIGKLDNRNNELSRQMAEMQSERNKRDEKFVNMESEVASLREQVNKDASERADLRKKLAEFEVKYRALWQYLVALLEQIKRHDLFTPVDPPKELASDPEIMRILSDVKKPRNRP